LFGCKRLLDRIAERVTGQDVALLNSGSVLRRDRDQHIDKAAQPTSCGAGQRYGK